MKSHGINKSVRINPLGNGCQYQIEWQYIWNILLNNWPLDGATHTNGKMQKWNTTVTIIHSVLYAKQALFCFCFRSHRMFQNILGEKMTLNKRKKKKEESKTITALCLEDIFVNTNTTKRFPSRLAELEDVALRNEASNYKTSLESRPSGIYPVGLNIHIYCWSRL